MTEIVNTKNTISTDLANAVAGSSSAQVLKNIGNNNTTIKMDDFLKIISTAMSTPSLDGDLSSSSSSTDYISQMSQFAMLQAVTDLEKEVTSSMMVSQQQQAFSLIGKNVTINDSTAGTVTGKVEKAQIKDGFAQVYVNGSYYDLGNLTEVGG